MAPYDSSLPVAYVQDAAENKPGHRLFVNYNLPEWVRHPLKKMPEKVAILFPGEQNHYVGMLRDAKKNPEVKSMLDMASKVFGFDLEDMMANGPDSAMVQTGYNQPLMYMANCAAYEMLKVQYPKIAENVQGIAGHGIGEYTALYAAGVITFEQGLSLVKARAKAMQDVSDEIEMEAMIISGFAFDKVDGMCTKAVKRDTADDPQAAVVAMNGPDSYIVAGRKSTILAVEEAGKKDAGKLKEFRMLPNRHHAAGTPLMEKAAAILSKALDGALPGMQPPRCELYLNATGWRVPPGSAPSKFIGALKEALTSPIMWEGSMDQMQRWGISSFYECGPGRSLKGMLASYEFIEESPLEIKKPGEKVTNVTV
jgi:[acyl-carrier-protein] S-malonyltransferase